MKWRYKMKIKANVRVDEFNNRVFYKTFEIVDKTAEIGDIDNDLKCISVEPVGIDCEQSSDDIWKYDYFKEVYVEIGDDENIFERYVAVENKWY
jgi:hypothetical protein